MVRSGSYFIPLQTHMGFQEYGICARSDHYFGLYGNLFFFLRVPRPLGVGGTTQAQNRGHEIRSGFSRRIFVQDFHAGFSCRILVKKVVRKYLTRSPQPERVSGSNLRENILYVHTIHLGVLPCPTYPHSIPIVTHPKVHHTTKILRKKRKKRKKMKKK